MPTQQQRGVACLPLVVREQVVVPVARAASDGREVRVIVRVRADGLDGMSEDEERNHEWQKDLDRQVWSHLHVARDAAE